MQAALLQLLKSEIWKNESIIVGDMWREVGFLEEWRELQVMLFWWK